MLACATYADVFIETRGYLPVLGKNGHPAEGYVQRVEDTDTEDTGTIWYGRILLPSRTCLG